MPVAPRHSRSEPLPPKFMPRMDSTLVVQFPGEVMQCKVVELVDADRVIVEVIHEPMSRTHHYRRGDRPGVRRRLDTISGGDIWDALDDRDFVRNRSPFEMRPGAVEQKPEPAKAKPKRLSKKKHPNGKLR